MLGADLKDFEILSQQEQQEAVALLAKYDQIEKQEECQKDFIKFSPNLVKTQNYINFLLSKQFDRENPNIQKALTYFQ